MCYLQWGIIPINENLQIMTTITLKINERTNFGKIFLAFIKTLSIKEKSIEVLKTPVAKEKSPYNPEFVKMVNKAEKSKKRYEVKNVNDLWASL